MGRPRTPTKILKLRGVEKVNPGRMKERDNEPENSNPIGDPPQWLSAKEQQAFTMLVSESIDGVLGEADRQLVAQAAKLLAKIMVNEHSHQENTLYNKCLAQMGFTPSDRARLGLQEIRVANELDQYRQRKSSVVDTEVVSEV